MTADAGAQKTVDDEFTAHDILTNCRQYPKDEALAAYKDFDAVPFFTARYYPP